MLLRSLTKKRSLNLSTSAGHETTDTLTTNPLSDASIDKESLAALGKIWEHLLKF